MDNNDSHKNIIVSKVENEIQERFLSYAMSVIVARALPLVDDGLKPVHRRILFAMHGLRLTPDKPHKKSARVVGEVIGKYHPHGDVAVYEAMTKMIQDFSCNYPLIDGHGNFGSVDGDSPAAMRYTEVRLSKISTEILLGINYDTVNFVDNYDGSEREPSVLPGIIPNLLVNGSTGIAVGMATSIPPHNLVEVLNTTIAYLKNEEITVEEIVQKKLLNGPDFPTGAFLVIDQDNLIQNLKTGRGSYKMRAKYHIEDDGDRPQIIIDEIPYQLNKIRLIDTIIDAVKNKKITQIADLRDESNRLGIRVVITLRKEAQSDIVLNQLFKLTPLQMNFSLNLLALHNNQPQLMNLLSVLRFYVQHQIKVLVRKTKYLLEQDQKRLEILSAIEKALQQIDAVIELIKKSKEQKEALTKLKQFLQINQIQAKAILEMRLQRLTGLQQNLVRSEIKELKLSINEYQKILDNPQQQKDLLIKRLKELKKKYDKPRQTKIIAEDQFGKLEDEDLILRKNVLVCLTKNNYLKRVDLEDFRHQKRGGVGVRGISLNEGDEIKKVLHVNTHDNLLFFTNIGKVYQLKAFKVPDLGRIAKGTPAQNLIRIDPNSEQIESIIRVSRDYKDAQSLFFVTGKGLVKRTALKNFVLINRSGKIAIKLKPKDKVIGASFASKDQKLLSINSDGNGKLTLLSNYRITNRGAKGNLAIKGKFINRSLVASVAVDGNESLLIAKSSGKFILTELKKTRITKSRSARGVKLVNLEPGEKIKAIDVFLSEDVSNTKKT